jgi:23S rRNA pseudouridine1911/1915/1917 synthase
MQKLKAATKMVGQRLDKALAETFPHYSRVAWQNAIVNGLVMVNGAIVLPRHTIKIDDEISIDKKRLDTISLPNFDNHSSSDIDIIYEDQSVLVINKPIGLITHPAHANTEDSVVHRVLQYNQTIGQAVYDPKNSVSLMRPGIVHRLDKDTSGVLIIAKTKQAMTYLAKQIESRKVTKIYQALLYGWLDEKETTVHNYLNRDTNDRRKMTVVEEGKGREATTIFRITNRLTNQKGDNATLAEAELLTGRTHQIRVHAASLHHPVLGDQTYTFKEARDLSDRLGLKRQFLHAAELTISLPDSKQPKTFTAPMPNDLKNILKQFHEI